VTGTSDFWRRPETVARFRDRDADLHLMAAIEAVADPAALRVLDLGCAGGRNADALSVRGAFVVALDASRAMCAATRDRIGGRVVEGRMDALPHAAASFDLVVALGIYQQGESGDEVRRAVRETARMLRPGGRVLVSAFSTAMLGDDARPVPGDPLLFDRGEQGAVIRFSEETLTETFGAAGLGLRGPVEERRGASERGPRVSLVATFERESG
jgi:SAM-dependent methyltransferase